MLNPFKVNKYEFLPVSLRHNKISVDTTHFVAIGTWAKCLHQLSLHWIPASWTENSSLVTRSSIYAYMIFSRRKSSSSTKFISSLFRSFPKENGLQYLHSQPPFLNGWVYKYENNKKYIHAPEYGVNRFQLIQY